MTDFELVSVAVSCGNGFCTRKCPFYSDDGSGCQRKLIDMLAKKLDIVLHQRDEQKISKIILENTYPSFDMHGKPVNIWKPEGYKKIESRVKGGGRNDN